MPARSDTALVTTRVYGDDGMLETTEDPKAIKTKFLYDDGGRQTHVVSNYTNYAGTNATIGGGVNDDEDIVIRYTYTDGLRATMVADMPSTQSDQTTTYTYGVTKGVSAGDSEFAHGALLQKVQYPDSSGGTDVVTYAYNAQAQQIWTKDQAGASPSLPLCLTISPRSNQISNERDRRAASGSAGDLRPVTGPRAVLRLPLCSGYSTTVAPALEWPSGRENGPGMSHRRHLCEPQTASRERLAVAIEPGFKTAPAEAEVSPCA